MNITSFKKRMEEGAWILDMRAPEALVNGYIPNAVYTGSGRDFIIHLLPDIISPGEELLLISEEPESDEALLKSAGYEHIAGYLDGGYASWVNSGEASDLMVEVEAEELLLDIPFDEHLKMIDVRASSLFEEAHLEGSENMPVSRLTDPILLSRIEDHQNLYIFGNSDQESISACSLIKKQGFHNLRYVRGGIGKIAHYKDVELIRKKKS